MPTSRCKGGGKSDSVLWIDLRVTKQGPPVGASFVKEGGPVIHILTDTHSLDRTIQSLSPKILGFEYDCPDIAGLIALSQTKRAFPNVPILMLTRQHSEALAVWAFRQGVWDYFTPPYQPAELTSRFDLLFRITDSHPFHGAPRQLMRPYCRLPVDYRVNGGRHAKITQPAVDYIECHYHEPIYLRDLAHACSFSIPHFSRIFKCEQGVPFTQYLAAYRVKKALELLAHANNSATNVAFAVGFSSPSHFTNAFVRHTGMRPSEYQRTLHPRPKRTDPPGVRDATDG